MKRLWLLYSKGMKQIWYVPIINVVIICSSTLYELYLKSSDIPRPMDWIFELLGRLVGITIMVAPIMLFYIYRDDWSRKTVCQIHSLPVNRYTILLSRLGIIYTVALITIAMITLKQYLRNRTNVSLHNRSLELILGSFIWIFLAVGVCSICVAIIYSIHRHRQIIGVLIIVGLLILTRMMNFNIVYSGNLLNNLHVYIMMISVASLYHVIALVIYNKFVEV